MQYNFLQNGMGDTVFGTHCGAVPLIGAAAVVDSPCALGLYHGPSAVPAAEKSGKGTLVLLKAELSGALVEQGLDPLPLLRPNDGLVGI